MGGIDTGQPGIDHVDSIVDVEDLVEHQHRGLT